MFGLLNLYEVICKVYFVFVLNVNKLLSSRYSPVEMIFILLSLFFSFGLLH